MGVEGFDSLEEMFERMASAEEEANARLTPEQIELRDDIDNQRYWARPYPEAGVIIFGEVWGADRLHRDEPQAWRDVLTRRTERGYLFGMAYSTLEPEGEPGDTHVANVTPISREAFAEAQAHGWRVIVPDRVASLMVPAEVLAEKTTPTLAAELLAADERGQ